MSVWEALLNERMHNANERRVAADAVRHLLRVYAGAAIDIEYPISRWTQLGTGDVRLVTPDRVVILETKYLDLLSSGKSASNKRTRHRKKVMDQCATYCAWSKLQHSSKIVIGFIATNDHPHPVQVVHSMSQKEATDRVIEVLENCNQPHVWKDAIRALRGSPRLSRLERSVRSTATSFSLIQSDVAHRRRAPGREPSRARANTCPEERRAAYTQNACRSCTRAERNRRGTVAGRHRRTGPVSNTPSSSRPGRRAR